MRLQDIVYYAWKNLVSTSLRTYLTVIGIVIGVIALVVIASISEGVQKDVNDQLSAFGPDMIAVIPGSFSQQASGAFGPVGGAVKGKLYERDADSIAGISGVDSVAKFVYGRSSLKFRDKEFTSVIYGGDSVFFQQYPNYLTLEEGRYFNDNDRRVAVLANDAAKKDFGKYELSVGNVIQINGRDYRIVGVLDRIGTSLSAQDDSSIYIPYEDARSELSGQLVRGEISMINIKLSEGYTSADVEDEITFKLASNHKVRPDDPDFTLVTSEFIEDTVGSLLSTLSVFLLFITLIATFVGAIGIMNTMLMGVLERVREIGILKAVGASENDILLIFIVESGMLGFIGGTIGLALGFLILQIVGQFAVPYLLAPWIIAFAFLFSAFVGIIAGAIPARKAAQLDPVDALRYE